MSKKKKAVNGRVKITKVNVPMQSGARCATCGTCGGSGVDPTPGGSHLTCNDCGGTGVK